MARFPKTSFLTALDVVDPREWLMARDRNSTFSTHLSLYLLMTKNGNSRLNSSRDLQYWRLNFTPSFLPTKSKIKFEDFLMERYDYVKDMNETEFMRFVINVNPDSPYDDFVR